MFALVLALFAALNLTPPALAQVDGLNYTVWSSVVFTRTGERTPEVLGFIPTTLTSIGANQAYAAGQFYRNRYIGSQSQNDSGSSFNGDEESGAPLPGLNNNIYSPIQLFAIALEQQYNMATAQAFLQGFYPPWNPSSATNGTTFYDETSLLANMTYIDPPLGGYQYPQIHAMGAEDYNYIYLSGNLNCPSFDNAAIEYTDTSSFVVTEEEFNGIYDAIGPAVFQGVLDYQYWDYLNAYAIYDYLRYQYVHNATIEAALDRYHYADTNISAIEILRWLSDQQQYAQLGDLNAVNVVGNTTNLPNITTGSISTIAGNTLAARVLDGLTDAIYNADLGAYKLNLLFADYHPLTSFFALMGLPEHDSSFYGAPEFGATAAFELFSWENSTNTTPTFPALASLYVRFYFRNGTDDGAPFRSYPLFNRGNDQIDMTWADFSSEMGNILMASVGDWCTACNASNIFCSPYNSALSQEYAQSWQQGNGASTSSKSSKHGLSAAVAGVIGAIVALVVAGMLFGLAMLIGGIRFHRNPTQKRQDLGGFKGGQKMRSDQDLTIPKDGAVVGATFEGPTSPAGGHERVGSWELKNAEAGQHHTLNVPGMHDGSVRPSMEERRPSPDPFSDPHGIKPVQPHERV